MKIVVILIITFIEVAWSICDFVSQFNTELSGSFGSADTIDDAKKQCLFSRPSCTGIIQYGSSSYTMSNGSISDSTTNQGVTSYVWDCPDDFPYYILESSYCAFEGYYNLDSNECESIMDDHWITFLLADSGWWFFDDRMDLESKPTGCYVADSVVYFNSNVNTQSAGGNIKSVCGAPPTPRPTLSPTDYPSNSPTFTPTDKPTIRPTLTPTPLPTRVPTGQPSMSPTRSPTESPTMSPTTQPSLYPTGSPTTQPSLYPTLSPTLQPTESPTLSPSAPPTLAPTLSTPIPTTAPTQSPTQTPTTEPTLVPTWIPTKSPTPNPSNAPTQVPTYYPTENPTTIPSSSPTFFPTSTPTNTPAPTGVPSFRPTKYPSIRPTSNPTAESDMEYCFVATMWGREYDRAVDDGLNEAVKDIFGVLANIHVLIDYPQCNTLTDYCEMRYCLIVEQDFGDIVEEAISINPSDLEDAWESNLESLNGPSAESSDPIVIEINYSAAFNLGPVDTFYGNWELLSAITFGSGALCCCFICICLRMKPSEIKLLLQHESPKVEMSKVPHNVHDDPLKIGQKSRSSRSLEIIEPGSMAKSEIIAPGSIQYRQNPKVNTRSIDEKRAMEMPLPDGVNESSDSDIKIGEAERQQSRFEGQTEIPGNANVHVRISPRYSEDEIARPAEYEYEEIARPATTRGH